MEELYALHDAMFRIEHRRNKFSAALKGIDLDEGQKNKKFDEIQAEAQAILTGGESEQPFSFDGIIGRESDDDD
jgi:hypothetical protein